MVFDLSTLANLAMSLGFSLAMIPEQGLVDGNMVYRAFAILLACDVKYVVADAAVAQNLSGV